MRCGRTAVSAVGQQHKVQEDGAEGVAQHVAKAAHPLRKEALVQFVRRKKEKNILLY